MYRTLMKLTLAAAIASTPTDIWAEQVQDWHKERGETNGYAAAPYFVWTESTDTKGLALCMACRDLGEKGYQTYLEIHLISVTAEAGLPPLVPLNIRSGSFDSNYVARTRISKGGHVFLVVFNVDIPLIKALVKNTSVVIRAKGAPASFSLMGSTAAIKFLHDNCPLGVQGPYEEPDGNDRSFDGSA